MGGGDQEAQHDLCVRRYKRVVPLWPRHSRNSSSSSSSICHCTQKHRQQRWHLCTRAVTSHTLLRIVCVRCVGTFRNATVRSCVSTKHAHSATCQQERAKFASVEINQLEFTDGGGII